MLTLKAPFATVPETARQQGQKARSLGTPLRRNPYDEITHPRQFRAWAFGWTETDEEITLLNLAAVTQGLLEQITEHAPGQYTIDPHVFAVFKHAAENASRFV